MRLADERRRCQSAGIISDTELWLRRITVEIENPPTHPIKRPIPHRGNAETGGSTAESPGANPREFEAGQELTETELTPMEFVELAKENECDTHTVALLIKPPMMETPFQCGRWWLDC